ncbi:MAG: hypothetical protein NVSMB38_21770 [Ktedonobacteraceae bacterium]
MKLTRYRSSEEQRRDDDEQDVTQKRRVYKSARQTSTLARKLIEATETVEIERFAAVPVKTVEPTNTATIMEASPVSSAGMPKVDIPSFLSYVGYIESIETQKTPSIASPMVATDTLVLPSHPKPQQQSQHIPQKYAVLLIGFLCIIVFHALNIGPSQFVGSQGWAYVLGGPGSVGDPNLLKGIGTQLSLTPGTTAQPTHHLTPQEYIHLIMQKMSLDQKLGQMMLVQFVGPVYSLELSTMVKQYNVGSVLIFAANQNIESKAQLKGLIQQMQVDSPIPLAVAIDQEGGYVDRLASLDGTRPAAADIGATGNPDVARQAGIQDAQDLSSYGINLNLAPVVDVTNVYNSQLDHRTYGNNADLVTKMAGAYLAGLQQSGKVLGTLKHFPGLGDVAVDPHSGVPQLTRSQADLEQIDWAPYRTLIQQGNTVHAVMVTHELVEAIDNTRPSSLSYKVVTGILRNELGFQGVIMTDSLTMEGIAAYYTEAQAAALSVEAGTDLLMGANTSSVLAAMIQGIKQAMNAGQISQQRIDDSVRRILLMKYQMGLLAIPAH